MQQDAHAALDQLELAFIDNWAALAKAFGMDPMLGRVHALAYLSSEPVDAVAVAAGLSLPEERAKQLLTRLAALGVVQEEPGARFVADADPWSWFLTTLRARGRDEFGPLLEAIRRECTRAIALRPAAGERARSIDRIVRFTQFVDQVAGLLETFSSLGAGPVLRALRMVARMRGPRSRR